MFSKITNAPVALSIAALGSVTISNGAPAVVGKAAHGLADGTPVSFTTTGDLPAGLVPNKTYYVLNPVVADVNSFNLVEAPGSTSRIATTSNGSGTHTATNESDLVLRINTEGLARVGLHIKNTGANALDLFDVLAKFHPLDAFSTVLSASANYTTPVYPCIRASASPTALAAGADVWMALDVTAFASIALKVSSAVGASTLSVWACNKIAA